MIRKQCVINRMFTLMGLIFILAGQVWAEEGIPEGFMLIEGDILISVDAAYDSAFGATYWPNGVVPYMFDVNVNATNQQYAIDAMNEWSAIANITFVLRTTENNYVRFLDHASKNYSSVGMVGGRQTIAIHNWTNWTTIAHEIAHTMGFWHEQSRPDRDTYVTINWDRIIDEEEPNFDKRISAGVYGPYDFDSRMHYSQCSFPDCGHTACNADPDNCRTITVKPPYDTEWQSKIGQKTHLSYLDKVSMQMIYPGESWIFVDSNYIGLQLGTFGMPHRQLSAGISDVLTGGTLIVQPYTYEVTNYTLSKAMLIRAPLGDVLFQ